MSLTAIHLKQFTAFDDLRVEFSPGVNVFVGRNGTGKTHLMKVAYAACDITTAPKASFPEKLSNVFLPSGWTIERLIKQGEGSAVGFAEVYRSDRKVGIELYGGPETQRVATVSGEADWLSESTESAYIPVNDILANAPGFRSLYAHRKVHFEDIYDDILIRAYLPPLREPAYPGDEALLHLLKCHMGGTVIVKGEEFFLQSSEGELEFSLLAEGLRKLGLLWLLIRNGTLPRGSVLFWDEPETNLNPKLYGPVIEVLLGVQRRGVQVFLATHDYAILKELDLQRQSEDKITFHSLYRDEKTAEIACHSVEAYGDIHPNAISDTFDDLYDRDVRRSLAAMRP